jgi:beta-fructofuranosidase
MRRAALFLSFGFAMILGARAADNSALKPHDDEAIARAMASDAKAAPRAEADPDRPAYHILAPANWINDPNGPIYHNGYWHMFYQHNPYGDGWGNMHWGHVRSRDLAHWEHLPIALWPSKEVGEEHVFSGCSIIRKDGKPAILYTSIGRGKSATDYAEQWLALGDDDLIRWEKAAGNPALEPSIHGATKIWDWRDPFLFKYKGDDYLVLGGNLNHGKGGEAVVNLYHAKDPSLLKWEYLGILFKDPDKAIANIECPNFFELDGKWVLIISPSGRVHYFIGSFDGKQFKPEKSGLLDESGDFYAPNCTTDDHGRRILWGWVHGFKGGQGWNGCHTLPRELSIRDGELVQRPVPEIEALRAEKLSIISKEKTGTLPMGSGQMEIHLACGADAAWKLHLFKGESNPGLPIEFNDSELKLAGTAIQNPEKGKPLNLRVFVDHSLIEVYLNDRACLSKVYYPKDRGGNLELTTDSPSAVSTTVYKLDSAWK